MYPTFDAGLELTDRQKLTYCLGAISELEAILCGFLRESCVDAGISGQMSHWTSGRCARELIGQLARPEFDRIGECRIAIQRVKTVINERNDTLHSEWLHREDGFVTAEIVMAGQPGLNLEHFELIHARLDIAIDIIVGMGYLLRQTRQLLDGEVVDTTFEQHNRDLVRLVLTR